MTPDPDDRRLQVVNMVAGGYFRPAPNLALLQEALERADVPGVAVAAPWVGCRIGPRSTWFAFYKSGRFSMAGLRDMHEAEQALQEAVKILSKARQAATPSPISILNLVITGRIPLAKDLAWIFERLHWIDKEYDPEIFPGMILKEGNLSLLIFASGAVTITGARTTDQASMALNRVEAAINAAGG